MKISKTEYVLPRRADTSYFTAKKSGGTEKAMDKENIFDSDRSGSDNLFDQPIWNPGGGSGGGHSTGFNDIATSEARRAFSRFGLALFFYLLAANLIVAAVDLVIALAFKDSYEAITGSYLYVWGMNILAMYVIAFPILYLIVKGMPKATREKEKIGFREFIATFAVAELFMYVGNYIGTMLNGIIGGIIGDEITNQTSELIENSPIWVIILVVVFIGPIVEELIFRKLLIDRLSRFGDKTAIIVSAIAFGLFHGNLYQFFYAALLGAVLAYIYVKSGNVIYPIIMHMLLNFLGSIVVMPVIDAQDIIIQFINGEYLPSTAEQMQQFISALVMMASYSIVQLTLVGIGIYVLVKVVRERRIKLDRIPEIRLPKERVTGIAFGNVGSILFLVICGLTMIASIFIG